jgi:uncharacterized FlaG/YvyC family protein
MDNMMSKNDYKRLYNLLVKIDKNSTKKEDKELKEMISSLNKNMKSINERLRRMENKMKRL